MQPTLSGDSSVRSGLMQYLKGWFGAYLIVFAHKLEHRNLEMLGKMVLWRVLFHRIIRNAAEESRGIGFNGFTRNGKRKRKKRPGLFNQTKKRRAWLSRAKLPSILLPLWPQEKIWEWWGKTTAMIIASPDNEQLSSRELAGRGPGPSAQGLPESCRQVCPHFTFLYNSLQRSTELLYGI